MQIRTDDGLSVPFQSSNLEGVEQHTPPFENEQGIGIVDAFVDSEVNR